MPNNSQFSIYSGLYGSPSVPSSASSDDGGGGVMGGVITASASYVSPVTDVVLVPLAFIPTDNIFQPTIPV